MYIMSLTQREMQILLKDFDKGLTLEKYNDQPDFIATKKQLRTAFIYLIKNRNYTYDPLKGILHNNILDMIYSAEPSKNK